MFPVPITLRHTGNAHLPSSATATFLASWTSKDGQPRCAHLAVALPLCLFVGLVAPVKSAGELHGLDITFTVWTLHSWSGHYIHGLEVVMLRAIIIHDTVLKKEP